MERSSWAGVFDECRGLRALPFGWNERFWKGISYENQDHMRLRTGRWGWCRAHGGTRGSGPRAREGQKRIFAGWVWELEGGGGKIGRCRSASSRVVGGRRGDGELDRTRTCTHAGASHQAGEARRGACRGRQRAICPAGSVPVPNRCIFLHLAACYDARMMPARWNRPQCIFGETLRKRETRAGLSLRMAARRGRGRRGRCWRREKGRGSGGCRGQRRRVALAPSGGRTAGVRRAKEAPLCGENASRRPSPPALGTRLPDWAAGPDRDFDLFEDRAGTCTAPSPSLPVPPSPRIIFLSPTYTPPSSPHSASHPRNHDHVRR